MDAETVAIAANNAMVKITEVAAPAAVDSDSSFLITQKNGSGTEQLYRAKREDVLAGYATKTDVGTPLVAATAADMTDTDKIYVYVGDETGYTAGDWYYYDGTEWQDGGVYNSVAFVTDDTLSVEGLAADAKATGEALETVRKKADTFNTIMTASTLDEWESGSFKAADGTGMSNSKRIRSRSTGINSAAVTAASAPGYSFCIYGFSGNTYLGIWTGAAFEIVETNAPYYLISVDLTKCYATATLLKFVVKRDDEADMSIVEGVNILYLFNETIHEVNETAEQSAEELKELYPDINDTSLWELGTLSNGRNSSNDARLRTITYIPAGLFSIRASNNYLFNACCYTLKGTYLGSIQHDGTISNDKFAWQSYIPVRNYSQYKIRLVLQNANDLTSTMQTSEAANCHFIVDRAGKSELKPLVGTPRLYLSQAMSDPSMVGSNTTEIYDRYDVLVTQYPKWFMRDEDIGYDSNGNAIRHYTLRMIDPIVGYAAAYSDGTQTKVNYWTTRTKYRRVLLTAGVHGNEKSAVWGLMYLIEELLSSSDEWARFIKGNFIIEILPIMCPWNYNHDSRTNKNGVNINRDYNSSDPEPETEAITGYIQSIKDDLFCSIDCHTTLGEYCYISTPENNSRLKTIMTIANQVFAVCVDDWVSLMEDLSVPAASYPYAYACMALNEGTQPDYMNRNGITNLCCTLEGIKFTSVSDRVKITKAIKDMICNLLQSLASIDNE